MWMIQIQEDGEVVVFRVSGRLEREQLAGIGEGARIACDVREVGTGLGWGEDCGSRCGKFSGAARARWSAVKELSRVHTGMDY